MPDTKPDNEAQAQLDISAPAPAGARPQAGEDYPADDVRMVDTLFTTARGVERVTEQVPGLSTQDVRTLLGLVTEDEFGRAVGVVGATVAIWRNKGEGPPFYRFRRNIFYRTADIVQWIIENTIDPKTGEKLMPEPLSGLQTNRPRPYERVPEAIRGDVVPLNTGKLRPDGTREPPSGDVRSSRPPAERVGAIGDHVPSVE